MTNSGPFSTTGVAVSVAVAVTVGVGGTSVAVGVGVVVGVDATVAVGVAVGLTLLIATAVGVASVMGFVGMGALPAQPTRMTSSKDGIRVRKRLNMGRSFVRTGSLDNTGILAQFFGTRQTVLRFV